MKEELQVIDDQHASVNKEDVGHTPPVTVREFATLKKWLCIEYVNTLCTRFVRMQVIGTKS